MQPLLTVRDAADILKVKEATIRAWVNQGRLAATKPGKGWLIKESDVQELLRCNNSSPQTSREDA